MTYCGYENCPSRKSFGSPLTFFKVPKNDDLKHVWIKHSASTESEFDHLKSHRLALCELHFHEKDLKSMAHRKMLKPYSVPIANGKFCYCLENYRDQECIDAIERSKDAQSQNRLITNNSSKISQHNAHQMVSEKSSEAINKRKEEKKIPKIGIGVKRTIIDLPQKTVSRDDITCVLNYGCFDDETNNVDDDDNLQDYHDDSNGKNEFDECVVIDKVIKKEKLN